MRQLLKATAFACVLAAGVLGGTATASAAPGNGTNQIDETSTINSVCGFPVVVHAVGVDRTTTSKDGLVTRNTFNVKITETNPATGGSLVFKNTGNAVLTFTDNPDGSFTSRQTFSGLNFRVETAQGRVVSSGRATDTLTFGFDEYGNFFLTQAEQLTPHLLHASDFLAQQGCAILAGS